MLRSFVITMCSSGQDPESVVTSQESDVDTSGLDASLQELSDSMREMGMGDTNASTVEHMPSADMHTQETDAVEDEEDDDDTDSEDDEGGKKCSRHYVQSLKCGFLPTRCTPDICQGSL